MPALHTTVPYSWRRSLGVFRPLLGLSCIACFGFFPEPQFSWFLLYPIAYVLISSFLVFRGELESSGFPLSLLLLDGGLLLVCLLQPTAAGTLLAGIAYGYLLLFTFLLYDWKILATVAGAALGVILLLNPNTLVPAWAPASLLAVLVILTALQRKNLHERLSAALKRSVVSRSEAQGARENERQRIAADFHDGPMQSFISFQMRLEIIRKMLERDKEAALRELVQLQDLGRAQVTELRAFVRQMQPAEVKPSNVQTAIRETVEHFERDSGITAELRCGDLAFIEDDTAAEMLQVIREALNNVRKHSKASRVSIQIESVSDEIEISVDDDGTGFPFGGSYSLDELEILRIGPRSIKRRVRTLGGDLTLQSKPTEGASLSIRIPA